MFLWINFKTRDQTARSTYVTECFICLHNLYGDWFFVLKVKRWCSSALEREYLKMHSRDITPAYLPMDKQVAENPDEIYIESLVCVFCFFSFTVLSL